MNGPLTSATNYALIAAEIRKNGFESVETLEEIKAAISTLGNSLVEEWFDKEREKGTDLVFMMNFHLRQIPSL